MATATTLATILRQAIRELEMGDVCVLADGATALTALATGSVTIPSFYQNTNIGSTQLSSKNAVIVRMTAASVADAERYAGALNNSSGLVAHTGANYADTTVCTEVVYVLFWGTRMAEMLASLNRVMQDIFFTTRIPLTPVPDGDMTVSTDTDWTDVLTPTTSAKSRTARRTPFGVRSYNLIGNAADEGTQSATIDVTAGHLVQAFTIASVNVGTADFRLYDVTNSAAADTAKVSSSEETPQLLRQPWQAVSSTAREIAAQMTNSNAAGDTFWNGLWIYRQHDLEITLPSFVSEHYQVPYIWQAVPVGQETTTNVYPARSLHFHPLVNGKDFFLVFNQEDANPSAVRFANSNYFEWPLFVQAKVPYSQLVTFAFDETATTNAPIKELMPKYKRDLLDTVLTGKMPIEQWALMSAKVGSIGSSEIQRSQTARPTKPEGKPREYFAGVRRG